MSMKITKKILAGTLALMNTFTAVSAAPVKNETPSSDSTSAKSEKPNDKSTKKELAKGAAIAAGGAAAVAAAVGGVFALFKCFLKQSEENKCACDYDKILVTLKNAFVWFSVGQHDERVENLLKKSEDFEFLFNAMENKRGKTIDKQRIIQCLERFSHDDDLKFSLTMLGLNISAYCLECNSSQNIIVNIGSSLLKDDSMCGFSSHDIFVVDVKNYSGLKNFKKVKFSEINDYSLKAIMIYNKEDLFSTKIYVMNKQNKWDACSLCKPMDESEACFLYDESGELMLSPGQEACLIYKK